MSVLLFTLSWKWKEESVCFELANYSMVEDVIATPKRKYRVLKRREKWSNDEHGRFLDALELYGRDWMRITQHVATKSRVQVRSHAQKYFLKLEKMQKEKAEASSVNVIGSGTGMVSIPLPPNSPTTPCIPKERNDYMDHERLDSKSEIYNEFMQMQCERYNSTYSTLSSFFDEQDSPNSDLNESMENATLSIYEQITPVLQDNFTYNSQGDHVYNPVDFLTAVDDTNTARPFYDSSTANLYEELLSPLTEPCYNFA